MGYCCNAEFQSLKKKLIGSHSTHYGHTAHCDQHIMNIYSQANVSYLFLKKYLSICLSKISVFYFLLLVLFPILYTYFMVSFIQVHHLYTYNVSSKDNMLIIFNSDFSDVQMPFKRDTFYGVNWV